MTSTTSSVTARLPAAARAFRLLVAVGLLCAACFVFTISCGTLGRGSIDVPGRRAGDRVTHLRGWTAHLFGAGQLVWAVAFASAGSAMLVSCRTASDRHPACRRLLAAAGFCLAVGVLLCTVPVFVERYL